tara:strand:+ start:207 stop:677 length:471 start_codon:yes stop_codon:yes gene_type:complete
MVDEIKKLEDLAFGDKNETNSKTLLETYFNEKMFKFYKNGVVDEFSTFDFYTQSKKYIEIKSRRTYLKDYPTQLIGHNKWIKALKSIKDGYVVYFIWILLDGNYIYKVNPLDVFPTRMIANARRKDKKDKLVIVSMDKCVKMAEKEQMNRFIVNFD